MAARPALAAVGFLAAGTTRVSLDPVHDPLAICRQYRDPCARVTNPPTTPHRSQDEYASLAGFQLLFALRRMNNALLGAWPPPGTYSRFEGIMSDAVWLADQSWKTCVGFGGVFDKEQGREFYKAACRRTRSAATGYPRDWASTKIMVSQRFLP